MHHNDIVIAATAMTPFGRHHTMSVFDLVGSVIDDLRAESGVEPGDIDAAFFGSVTWGPLQGQLMAGGQIALREHGLTGMPIFNVENACATGASALHLAVNYVRSGLADLALAVGVEKMNVEDKNRSLAVFDGAYDVSRPAALGETLSALGGATTEVAGSRSIFMDIYAAIARAYMRDFGTTQEQIAAVAAKNHAHAELNDKAFYRKPMSVDEVLAGRALDFPLTVPMCAPVTDGAAGVVVGTREAVRRLRNDSGVDVEILASVMATGTDRALDDWDSHVIARAGRKAYDVAGVDPGDVDVAEVHDATAFAEILVTERLGLCKPGEGGPDALNGRTSLGGGLPINPSGGLESKGHPLAATGLGQIHELVEQLRGRAGGRQVDGARIALAENGGGFHRGEEAVAAITILGRN